MPWASEGMAMSGLPSPFRSPTAGISAPESAGYSFSGAKVPLLV